MGWLDDIEKAQKGYKIKDERLEGLTKSVSTATKKPVISKSKPLTEKQKREKQIAENQRVYEESKKQAAKETAKEWVGKSMQEAYKHPLMQPGRVTPEGAVIGALEGATKLGPDLSQGNYESAAFDALSILPMAPGAIKNAYKLNPKAVKENPNMMLYRARPVGQDPSMNMAAQIRAKEAAGQTIPWWQKNILTTDNPGIQAREKYFGQWFEKDPNRLGHYLDPGTTNFAEQDALEILRTKLPKEEAARFNVSQFEDANRLSLSPETEFVLPKEQIHGAERFPVEEWQRLIKEHEAFNTPHWLKGFKKQNGGRFDGLTNKGFNYNGAWGGPAQNGAWLDEYQDGGNMPGSVGFSYARTGAPSNGKYAKKTLPSAQNGITKDNNGYWDPKNWGKPVEIDSNDITMKGVKQSLIGIGKQSGDKKLMKPGKNYNFANDKQVIEYPVAQDGKNILYNSKYNDKSALDEQKAWLSNWMSHPEYTKRLSKNLKESNSVTGEHDVSDFFDYNFRGDDYYNNQAKDLADKSKLKMLRTKVFSPSKESNSSELIDKYTKDMKNDPKVATLLAYYTSAGMYRPSTGDLLMKENRAKTSGTHELTHSTGLDNLISKITPAGNKVLKDDNALKKKYNTRDVRWYSDDNVFGRPNSILPDFLEDRKVKINPDDLSVPIDTRSYINKSDEVYPRIMQMRYTNDLKPGQIIDKKSFKTIKEKSKDDEIFDVYDDNQIIEMLNKFASINKSDKNTFVAKNGASLTELDQLTNFTNYNTPQPGGWLDDLK